MQTGELHLPHRTGLVSEGDRPFFDRLNLKTLKTERLFRSDAKSLRDSYYAAR